MDAFFLDFWFPFLLIFARIIAFIGVLPFFGWRGVPVLLRVFVSFVLSILLTLNWEGQLALPVNDLASILLFAREFLIGLLLGFLVYLYLSIFLMAGQFMDHKAGLMMAGMFDPLFGGQVTILGQFFYMFAVVLFLTVNGHHILFFSLLDSLKVIPLAGSFPPAPVFQEYIKHFYAVFLLAFQIATPVVIVLWLLDIALGFISKTVPQIHVFIVGLPLKIAFVLLVFILMCPFLGGVMNDLFDQIARDFIVLMRRLV
ncbi:MAG: flagellar biosynthetic protein FliR [Dethiobacteria bacterium]